MKKNKLDQDIYNIAKHLLQSLSCPLSMHEVVAQFMGAIASPIESINPLEEAKTLWGGELPKLESIDQLNELKQVLVIGLWNQLSMHNATNNPFKLTPLTHSRIVQDILQDAEIKNKEIEAFMFGFYQRQKTLKLPNNLVSILSTIEELGDFFYNIGETPISPNEKIEEIDRLIKHLQKLTYIAEIELNNIITQKTEDRQKIHNKSKTLH